MDQNKNENAKKDQNKNENAKKDQQSKRYALSLTRIF